ncbi:phosphotransferase enzyme family protein [Lacinutrix chionoecetis]
MVNILKRVANQFETEGTVQNIKTLNSGHINDTYLITTTSTKKYVLQKLNSYVFKDTIGLINNKIKVSKFLSKHLKTYSLPVESTYFYKSKKGEYYVIDQDGFYWNLQNYIPNSITFNKAPNSNIVFEAGKLYGAFLLLTSTISPSEIKETLPDFHSVPLRLNQFEEALKNASEARKTAAKSSIDQIFTHKTEMCKLSKLNLENAFPIRVTHNDTKLSNILFNKANKGIAVIDLDTVMPGIVHYDFGDSIRSICSNAEEDDENFEVIEINIDFYEAYCNGYATYTKSLLTKTEIAYLPLGIKTIIYIMGLRFLTDFLNNDKYYKTNYKTHNLVRAKNQFALLNSVIKNYKKMEDITLRAFNL